MRAAWSCAFAALLLTGSASGSNKADEFLIAREGYRYDFPRDHGAHEGFRTEWWYYTGHLSTKDGRRLGYQLTFFRRGFAPADVQTLPSRWSVTQLYLAHFAVSDLSKGQFHYAEKVSRAGLGKAGADAARLDVWIDDWSARAPADSARHSLRANDGTIAIALDLRPEKPPVAHGLRGVSLKGTAPGQASHYYSLTRLTTSGSVSIGAESLEVAGTSWMDHEFGSADLGEDLLGWDWFSVQLEDKTELMLYRLRRRDGTTSPVSSGTFVDRDGRAHHLSLDTFTLDPVTYWTSPTSHARYPQRWRLTVPSRELSLEIAPLLAEQELSTGRSTQVTYWEGAIAVSGTEKGRSIKGEGYMELTGYAEPFKERL
ncbi:MAG TPA: lipocalin-like domain-containing protein [Nitrospira sp.]|nr:lipocalin-like domain-containing protein [Nitrospira sp.]